MPLEGQWARQHEPLRRRERRVVVAVLGAIVVCAIVLVAAVHGASGPAPGCVDATIASTTGGAAVRACGERARRLCAAPGVTAEIRLACRHVGLSTTP
jgi:hypothetical protein